MSRIKYPSASDEIDELSKAIRAYEMAVRAYARSASGLANAHDRVVRGRDRMNSAVIRLDLAVGRLASFQMLSRQAALHGINALSMPRPIRLRDPLPDEEST